MTTPHGVSLDRGTDSLPEASTPRAEVLMSIEDAKTGPIRIPALGAKRTDRVSVVALFRVNMFPLGHLPVPVSKPAEQLPAPEDDFIVGLRFPPGDHPDPVDTAAVLDAVPAQALPSQPGEPPAVVLDGHSPYGSLDEKTWSRRYLGGMRGDTAEYAWPPGALFPEGGTAPGEAITLPVDTVVDRFGAGRIFAPDATPLADRALPSSSAYRRYRVTRALPVWRTVTAPWFGQPGGGTRYRAAYSAEELVTLGYLEAL
ncbi:TNT domain-containing protein [Amycolatopsis sp. cg5]|uniref:TNT domain-containing protein n=1 Tax=Amycolatopsis sp. cg5 TaxID=3238802 RepID=UPI003526C34A